MSESGIVSVLEESRVFEPDAGFKEDALVSSLEAYKEMYERSVSDPEGF